MNLMHDLHIPVTIRPAYHPTSYPDLLQDKFSFLVLNRPQTDASSYRVWHLCLIIARCYILFVALVQSGLGRQRHLCFASWVGRQVLGKSGLRMNCIDALFLHSKNFLCAICCGKDKVQK